MDRNVIGATTIGVPAGRGAGEAEISQQEVLRIDGESDDGFALIASAERQNHKRAPSDFRDNFA